MSNNLILLQINLQLSKIALKHAPVKIIKEMNYMYVTFLTLIQLFGLLLLDAKAQRKKNKIYYEYKFFCFVSPRKYTVATCYLEL